MNYKSTEVINILGWYSDTRNIVSAMDGDSMQGLLLVSKRKKKRRVESRSVRYQVYV